MLPVVIWAQNGDFGFIERAKAHALALYPGVRVLIRNPDFWRAPGVDAQAVYLPEYVPQEGAPGLESYYRAAGATIARIGLAAEPAPPTAVYVPSEPLLRRRGRPAKR